MTTIKLGVMDLPYSFSANIGKTKSGKHKGQARASTTGDVAEILEAKYGVMSYFWDRHQTEVLAAMEGGLQNAFDSLMQGAPASSDPFAAGAAKVEEMFQHFLDAKEMDGRVGGVPTEASLKGVSHRFKRKRGPVRPSFIDTGLYESSFKCWVE